MRATRAGRPASKATTEWGHGVGRHGVVPGAACGPVVAHVVGRASCGRQASVGDKQAWFVSSYEEWTQQQFEHVCAARIA